MTRLSTVEEGIEEIRQGRMIIVVDDEDRENEGDLVIPAQMATPEAINFMARYGRGLICLALTSKRVEELGLPLMAQNNGTRHQTAFTVSALGDDRLEVSLIPETLERTTLGQATIGTAVNLEVDVLAKYIERLVPAR